MKRRSFVKASLLSGALPALMQSEAVAAQQKHIAREYYELRTYTLKNAQQQQLVEDYYRQAAIPAYNKAGCQYVGVFTELKPEGQTSLYVLIAYPGMEAFGSIKEKLMKDAAYQSAANAYLNAPATEPAYERIESSLFYALTGMPKLVLPGSSSPRIFELRRYESPGEAAGLKKIEMFNVGEMEIFKNSGLRSVFFGQSLIGTNQPNLTYMLAFDDMAAHDTAWKTFGGSDAWNKLKSIPDYADAKLISKITATFLQPVSFSQI